MNVIEASNITKTYRIGVGRARVREMLPPPIDRGLAKAFSGWWSRDTFNALEDVSFAVEGGGSVGIVGHNGAGKTTLLKVIADVTAPTRGTVRTHGKPGALLDLFVGFHPDLTGVENSYLLGAIHGYGRRAMKQRIERVLDFAEISDLAETPIKRYSAGMQARLGFSILVAIEPEILLIDEVLAVGDASFQRKCTEWLGSYREKGGTLVFVSHNLGLVRSMTDRVVWIDHGSVVGDGDTLEILGEYARALERRDTGDTTRRHRRGTSVAKRRGMYRWGAGGARVEQVHIDESNGQSAGLEISISYHRIDLERGIFCLGFLDESGQEIGAAASPEVVLEEHGTVRCAISPALFRPGIYFPVAAILSTDGRMEDRWRLDRAIVIDRNGSPSLGEDFGPVRISASWTED
jgi:lipopolysaccharide transport system ATP-binding protein